MFIIIRGAVSEKYPELLTEPLLSVTNADGLERVLDLLLVKTI